ncbi:MULTISPECIES: peroxidase family protein [unclassified Blastococcus]
MQPNDGSQAVCPFSGAGGGSRIARRGFLTGAMAAAMTPALAGLAGTARAEEAPLPTDPTATTEPAPVPAETAAHAVGDPRGADIAVRTDRSQEARFGLMFKTLPAYAPTDGLLLWLAADMNDQKPPLTDVKDSDRAFDNPGMPAGYIYFGQFVDHDMTFDKTPLSHRLQDPLAMRNYDTPWFDLGSVYGKGLQGSPELYEQDPARQGWLKVNPHDDLVDLPRDDRGAAYLGDPRNDENLIVAQLHTVFIRLHNKFMSQGMTYAQARRQTRWHYQWLIVNDYLPRIVGRDVVSSLIRRDGTIKYTGTLYRPTHPENPYMPIEYSGAAYRFGHSMIRAEYEMQDGHTVPIFGADGFEDLRGNRPIPANLWADWNYFFDIPGLEPPDDRNMARLIDTDISLPLYTLPSTVVAPSSKAIVALAERNLLRGKRLGLPCGQDVARAMGITPLTNEQLGLRQPGWGGKAPLWYYVLKEAELVNAGRRLGPVGGRIVAETILGIMALDPESYFNLKPAFQWQERKTIGDLILLADALDPRSRIVLPDDEVQETGPLPLAPDEQINPEATTPVSSLSLVE